MRLFIATLLISIGASHAYAWGDKGHEVVALIAWHYLSPVARERIETLLQHDDSALTATDFVSESTWADAYRDSDRNGSQMRYEQTRRWHYVNLEISQPDFNRACFDSPKLLPRQKAIDGPAKACVVDKIEQFSGELKDARTEPSERLLALQFLIHLIGDLHQPLHASDNADNGGNDVLVISSGFERSTLHSYWDNVAVSQLGRTPAAIADALLAQTHPQQLDLWRHGTARDWALETLSSASKTAYANLPLTDSNGVRTLDETYVKTAKNTAAQQLTKAGVRLAWLLNQSIASR